MTSSVAQPVRREPGPTADLAAVLGLPTLTEIAVPVALARPGPLAVPITGAALFVLDGAVMERERLGHRVASCLLGPGDLLAGGAEGEGSFTTGWQAVTTVSLAAVDVRALLVHRPALTPVVLDASTRRCAMLAQGHVIAQLVSLQERLMAIVPQLADTWGVVTPDGVILPAFLSHRVMADLLAVRRPSFTTAATRFEREGLLHRLDDGRWRLGAGLG